MLAPSTLPSDQTRTPKEQVLQNDYLLREIFGYLESCSKRQLLAVALTCRSFLEPAQDCLWRSMHSISPFLKLLPSFQLVFGVQTIMDNKPLSSYPRFKAHSVRVQEFLFADCPAQDFAPLSSLTVPRLLQLKGSEPLFPALRRLGYASGGSVREDITLFIESPLTDVQISDYTRRDIDLPPILCMLPSLERTLTWLYLSGSCPLNTEVLKAISCLTELRDLHLKLPTQNALFGSLAKLRKVETLDISASESFILHLLLQLPSRHVFSFRLARTDRSTWVVPFPSSTTTQSEVPVSFWHQCAEIICEKWGRNVKAIIIEDIPAPQPFDAFPFSSFIEMLYPMHQLEVLEIKNVSTIAVEITDNDYASMASSWPNLKVLHLYLPCINPPPSLKFPPRTCHNGFNNLLIDIAIHPTIQSLFVLANNCLNLTSLHIYLPSIANSTHPSNFPTTVIGHPALRDLWLGNCSVLIDPVLVATQLNTMFPGLERVAGVVPTPGKESSGVMHPGTACGFEWLDVQRWVRSIKSIRAAERERIVAVLKEEGVELPGRAQRRVFM